MLAAISISPQQALSKLTLDFSSTILSALELPHTIVKQDSETQQSMLSVLSEFCQTAVDVASGANDNGKLYKHFALLLFITVRSTQQTVTIHIQDDVNLDGQTY